MTAPMVFLDAETTSLRDDRKPWEIAMIRRDGEGAERSATILVSDIDLTEADPFALKVGKFYDRHPGVGDHEGVTNPQPNGTWLFAEATAAQKVERWTRGAYIVASNPAFDAATLAAMLKRHKLIPAWSYHLIDVRAMAIGFISASADRGSFLDVKSDELAEWCGIDVGLYGRHTAMGDATMVRDWYDAMTGGAQ